MLRALCFKEESFDVIWAEGSIYVMGFEAGLRRWKAFLKWKGYLAVSELTWLAPKPPEDLCLYWQKHYPQMNSIEDNVDIICQCGYIPAGYFVLPRTDWLDNYYASVEKKLTRFRHKYADDSEALAVLEEEQKEIDMYRKYSQYYGYVFYIARRD